MATKETEEEWLGDVIARFPRLKGRLFLNVPVSTTIAQRVGSC
jgi:hypothetical protein